MKKNKCIYCLKKDDREMVRLKTVNAWYHPECYDIFYEEGDMDESEQATKHNDPVHVRI